MNRMESEPGSVRGCRDLSAKMFHYPDMTKPPLPLSEALREHRQPLLSHLSVPFQEIDTELLREVAFLLRMHMY